MIIDQGFERFAVKYSMGPGWETVGIDEGIISREIALT